MQIRTAVLTGAGVFHLAAQALRHELEAVAHAEDGDAGLEERTVEAGAPSSYTDEGPPDRMIAAGFLARISSTGMVLGTISL
ncbi:hypothetical protein SHKM778_10200 [Streptomyces sp. KM77-8]|uniref:Uncharacterized protein n=1 Tax=Streptomyces haneummycinicus TaxID=3074435 RepID=A0AAT9HB92_9ACTN